VAAKGVGRLARGSAHRVRKALSVAKIKALMFINASLTKSAQILGAKGDWLVIYRSRMLGVVHLMHLTICGSC
jgi:hypothetical protein